MYACESWTLTAELQRSIQAIKVRCYHEILHISYKDHVTNEEVGAKIQQAIRPHEDLLTIVERRKLQWYGHVSRSSGLAKTILQGTVKGGRRQGRQRKRWEDNIREWTGLEFTKSQRVVEKRKNGGNWLWNHLWCFNNPRGQGIDDYDDDEWSVHWGVCSRWRDWLLCIKIWEMANLRRRSYHWYLSPACSCSPEGSILLTSSEMTCLFALLWTYCTANDC